MEPKRLRPVNNIKRSLTLRSNYPTLVACKLLLDKAALEVREQYVIAQATRNERFPAKYWSAQTAIHRAMDLIPLNEIHKFSQVKAKAIRHKAFVLCLEMMEEFYKDIIKYFKETGQSAKDLPIPSMCMKQLEYLSAYLTYDMEGKKRPTAPLALLRNKRAAKNFPIKERTSLKILSITPIPKTPRKETN